MTIMVTKEFVYNIWLNYMDLLNHEEDPLGPKNGLLISIMVKVDTFTCRRALP